MIPVALYNKNAEPAGNLELDEKVFGEALNLNLVHRVFQWWRTQTRQANASTKNRGDVRGGGRKPWRQKGTGRARAGSIRSPLWRGGGVTFGPKPREIEDRLPVKVIKKGMRMVLSELVRNNSLIILKDEEKMPEKTKEAGGILKKFGLAAEAVLFISPENGCRAFRNLAQVEVLTRTANLNIGMILKNSKILTFARAIKEVEALFKQ